MAGGLAGLCSAPLRNLEPTVLKEVLRQAAQARLHRKAEAFQARARQVGWDNALWEGLFAALGYKKNTWPMRRVAELLPMLIAEGNLSLISMQARLLGISGLLPSAFEKMKPSEAYLRSIWDLWWREADQFREFILPEDLWVMGGNAAGQLSTTTSRIGRTLDFPGDIPERLEGWLSRTIESPDFFSSVETILQVKEDPFWSYRWTLRGKPFSQPQPLLGEQRITDLIMNVVLPWLYVRALAGKNEKLAQTAESHFFLWPSGEDNSVLKLGSSSFVRWCAGPFFQNCGGTTGYSANCSGLL